MKSTVKSLGFHLCEHVEEYSLKFWTLATVTIGTSNKVMNTKKKTRYDIRNPGPGFRKALIQPAIILTESVVNVLKIKAIQKLKKKPTKEENSVLHII